MHNWMIRGMAVTALTVPLAFGMAGVASAQMMGGNNEGQQVGGASYLEGRYQVGPNGAELTAVRSGANDDGTTAGATYLKSRLYAGPNGAGERLVTSRLVADPRTGAVACATYHRVGVGAGPQGASMQAAGSGAGNACGGA